eukprot:GHUV01002232.1.p1 GENE.GHUV01002232.1~~GHUV01002232.1.p1  ORF type:complete len:276 (+),score=66.00 GHUV01002232.1:187-1014(+)
MKYLVAALLISGTSLIQARVLTGSECPPAGLDSAPNFDLKKYISAPWYPLEMVVVSYQPPRSFYCTRARYIAVNPSDLSRGVDVINYSNNDRVNGPAVGVSGAAGNNSFALFAVPAPATGSTAASKLLVGPKAFVAKAPATVVAQQLKAPNGNYRVVAVGPSKNSTLGYDWAIIVGGTSAPSEKNTTSGLCTPSKAQDEGLWLFHRNPLAPSSDVQLMKQKAKDLGIDTNRLLPVQQKGCKYEGADPSSAGNSGAGSSSTGGQQAASKKSIVESG